MESLIGQIGVFGVSILFGIAMGAYYTCYRLLRYFICFSHLAIFFQDIIFFLSSAIAAYTLLMNINTGEVRGYILFAISIGFLLYHLTLGGIIFAIGRFIIDKFKLITEFIKKKIVSPIRHVLGILVRSIIKIIRKIMKTVFLSIKKRLKFTKKFHKKVNIA